MTSNKEAYCGNCGGYLEPGDAFCMFCGAERCESEFRPEEDIPTIAYGMPMRFDFACESCGHSWYFVDIGRSDVRFCPKCGKEAPKMLSKRYFGERSLGF